MATRMAGAYWRFVWTLVKMVIGAIIGLMLLALGWVVITVLR